MSDSKVAGSRIWYAIATLGGAGYAPIAPGTVGSIVALPLAAISAWSAGAGAVLLVIIVMVGIPAATHAAQDSRRKDPGFVVIDEAAGMVIAGLAVPLGILPLLLAFFLFRLFDIVKPPPCRRLEKLPDGWGIMLDDLVAGIYAAVAARGILIGLGQI